MAGLLERYPLTRPFGQNTAMSDGNQRGTGGYAGSQFRRQEQAYGRALRILDRQARRGDANAAVDAIRVRDTAMQQGYSVGGIRPRAEAEAGILGRLGEMERRSRRTSDTMGMTANPAATAGAGYGRPTGSEIQPAVPAPTGTLATASPMPAPTGTLAEQATAATERSTMSGAFGEGAKSRLLERKRRLADRKGAIGGTLAKGWGYEQDLVE